MKLKLTILALSLALATISCKKQSVSSPEQQSPDVKLENDYLAFKDQATFFKYYQLNSTLSESERLKWEQSMHFNSLTTIYNKFNSELDELEKGTKENYFNGFKSLQQQYKGAILFTEDSYKLNSSGMKEAALANKNGILKVGNDYLYTSEKGVTTYKSTTYEKALEMIASKVTTELYGAVPPPNSFTSRLGGWYVVNKDRGRVLMRMKLYNINNPAFGYQSFSSLEGMAEHKNVFGTWRDVNMSINFTPVSSKTPGMSFWPDNLTSNLGDYPNSLTLNPNCLDGLYNTKHFDRVLAISNGLQGKINLIDPNAKGSSEFVNYAIAPAMYPNTNLYWRDVSLNVTEFSVMIQPGGVLSNPAVVFNSIIIFDTQDGGVINQ
ncbi:uncharacterized protein YdcH (DUF465 family) [Pedobacter cryoconitis]|uniref:Uncharacterized protein YdcH (DUF465 family) n=1 Tax=Pedobacter cryoconitis TaxID=188932 RepID=A0A7W9DHT9_9SPHI|nr:hypothetical protein [Pedobacter cryoconitis]MBB5618999.1 uncharacterized protein YdcH (DUF465 family) [Pedobacter cryoconitis]